MNSAVTNNMNGHSTQFFLNIMLIVKLSHLEI